MTKSNLFKALLFGLISILSLSANAELNVLTEVTDFGSNPGSLKMYKYVPENVKSPAPMVVAVHACTQNAEMYNDENDWALLADRYGFIVMFPETNTINQMRGCFTWYQPSDYDRGQGEALSIYNMVNKMKADHDIDGEKVFISGLSAGACMAANLIASYPDVYKGAAIHAGVPYGSATNLFEGMDLYDGAFYDKTPQQWGDLFRGAHAGSGYTGPMPKVSIIFGTNDHRFDPQWAFEQLEGYFNIHGIDGTPDAGTPYAFRRADHYTWSNNEGEQVIEMWHMEDMLHVQTVDPCEEADPANCAEDKGGHIYSTDDGTRFEHTEDWDLWGSYYSAKFFGLTESGMSVDITSPANNETVVGSITATAVVNNAEENVDNVAFYVDGAATATCTDTTEPYECLIDTTLYADGIVSIKAVANTASDAAEKSIDVNVDNIDDTAPVITLVGNATVEVIVNGSYTDQGATASDDKDGDLTANIVVDNPVNTAVIGTYVITYNVSDNAGNAATQVTRTVIVKSAPTCVEYTSTVSQHESVGRAYSETTSGWWWNTGTTTWYAVGSDENLGTSGSTTVTLKEDPEGSGVFAQGECPADPQPPVITGYSIDKLDYYQLVVSGTATDVDGDLNRVVLGLGAATGVDCQGTTNFTCTVDFETIGMAVGSGVGAYVTAYDSLNNTDSTEPFQVVRPANEAPIVVTAIPSVTGVTVTVTGTASDVESDIASIAATGTGAAMTCTGTESFSCTVTDLAEGDYTYNVVATDALGQQSAAKQITFTVNGLSVPVVDSIEYTVNGTDLLVTGTASDVDGDLTTIELRYADDMGTLQCTGTTTFTCDLQDHAEGTYNFQVWAIDATNRVGISETFTVTFEIVTNPPSVDSHSVVVDGDTVTITGTASDIDGDLQAVVLTGSALPAPLTCTGTENFTCTVSGLAEGTYSFELTASDVAGNSSDVYGPITAEISSEPVCITATNSEHISNGRAYMMYNILVYAEGSDQYLGLSSASTSLEETSPGYWEQCN